MLQRPLAASAVLYRWLPSRLPNPVQVEYSMSANSKILIVDDEMQIRSLLSLTFKRAGYAVTTAANARDAIALLAAESFDLVLSDVVMPEMDGHQLAQWVAAHHPSTRTALMSGYDPGCRNCAYSSRCRLIAKPFQPRQMLAFVEETLAAPLPS
jgi:DNA-binding NtrC family response regulator